MVAGKKVHLTLGVPVVEQRYAHTIWSSGCGYSTAQWESPHLGPSDRSRDLRSPGMRHANTRDGRRSGHRVLPAGPLRLRARLVART